MARYGSDYRGGGGYDMQFGNWGQRSGLWGRREGYDSGYGYGYRGAYDREMFRGVPREQPPVPEEHWRARGWGGLYNRGFQQGSGRPRGPEGSRGGYGGDFRPGGGYRDRY
jgi:hypothetical protein